MSPSSSGEKLESDRVILAPGNSARELYERFPVARAVFDEADEVELIDAHGSSSKLNDATETLAIKRTFGAAGTTIPVVATKGQHGHALGATGAWEVALTLLALREGRLPGAVNLEHRDPECDVDVVRATRVARPRLALSNSTGFGGINAALVLRNVEA